MTSPGIAAPPEMQTRRLERSYSAAAGSCSTAKNIVGTPGKMVTRSRTITSSTFLVSKRGTSVIVAPEWIALFMMLDCPKEWKSGSIAITTSSSV